MSIKNKGNGVRFFGVKIIRNGKGEIEIMLVRASSGSGGSNIKTYIDTTNYNGVQGNNVRTFNDFKKIYCAILYYEEGVQRSIAVLNADNTWTITSNYNEYMRITSVNDNVVNFFFSQASFVGHTRMVIVGE